jgi:hypothetical protein
MSNGFVQIAPDSNGKKIDNAVLFRDGAPVFRQRVEAYLGGSINTDPSGRLRASQLTTLFDGKTLVADDPLLWSNAGTGTLTFDRNMAVMSVIPGQYQVRQGRFFCPYFSGKPQLVEPTFDTFAPEPGLVKRVGYFSSSPIAPYEADFDGCYLESNGDTGQICLVVVNRGNEKLRAPIDLPGYDWNNFTVALVDFLWLGGAALRLFIKHPEGGFAHVYDFDYAGTSQGVFMESPQQPVRYEIRSTTGTGSFRAICSQVASEGSISERGQSLTTFTPSAISCSSIGTIYALKAVRKSGSHRNTAVRLLRYASTLTSTNARGGTLMLLLAPTLSAPLTYTSSSRVLEATGDGAITVTNTGRVLDAVPVDVSSSSAALALNALAELPVDVDGTAPEAVLAYQPASSNQTILASLALAEY